MFNSTTTDARKPLMRDGQGPQLLNPMQHTEGIGTEPFKSNILKLESPKLPDMPLTILDFELGLLPESSLAMEMVHKLSSLKNFRRILDKNNSTNKKVKEETHPDFSGEKSFNVASAVNINSACQSSGTRRNLYFPHLIKKGEELSNLQAAQKMHEGRMKALIKEEIDLISNFHAVNEFGVKKSLKLLFCTTSMATINLEFLLIAQLRAMAKKCTLKRYSKLHTSDLIKHLLL